MRKLHLLAPFWALVWVTLLADAHAGLILSLGQGGTTAGISNSFFTTPGSSLTLDVWVTQSGTFQPIPGFDFGDFRLSDNPGTTTQDGLGSYVYDATSNNATVTASATTFASGFLKDVALDAAQPGGNVLRVGAFAVANQAQLAGGTATPVFAPAVYNSQPNISNTGSVASNSILLGTVTYTIGAAAPAQVNIGVSSPYIDGVNLYWFGIGSNIAAPAFALAPTAASATLNIGAVPEPMSVMFATAVAGLGLSRFRRKKQAPVAKV